MKFTESIDELGDIRRKISDLRKREAELAGDLKEKLQGRVNKFAKGNRFEAILKEQQKLDTSIGRIEKVFGEGARKKLGKKSYHQLHVGVRT